MTSLGLCAEDLEFDIDVYPENWRPFCCFVGLQTQWHIGAGGRTGLMYDAVYQWLDEQGIKKRSKRQEVMQSVQVMEMEALRVWAEQQA